MRDVLEAHAVAYREDRYDEDFNCHYRATCRTCGPLPDDTPEADHQADALAGAGFGSMPDALRAAAAAFKAQPPKLRDQYVTTLRLYADQLWRIGIHLDPTTERPTS